MNRQWLEELASKTDHVLNNALRIHNVDTITAHLHKDVLHDRTHYYADGKLLVTIFGPQYDGENLSFQYFIGKVNNHEN